MEASIVRASEDFKSNNLVCFGCNQPITDQYLAKALDQLWHEKCIRCCECQTVLNEKCFTRNTKLYCKQDFHRLFGVKCAGCREGIYPSDMVRRLASRIFHTACLKCCHCEKEVETGDQLYVIEDGSFLCKTDYESYTKGETRRKVQQKSSPPHNSGNEHESTVDDKPPSTSSMNGEQQISDEEDESNRRRGPRTTIKAKQLEVLKSAFLATPKPSRHIREKLAQDTGLTMRVIQVWFQNRRSKERRVKQLSVQDVRRGFRKNSISKDGTNGIGYHFFQNGPSPVDLDKYHQNGFSYDSFNNNTNTSNDNNTTTTTTNNNMSINLPTDDPAMDNTANAILRNKFDDDSTDFNILNSFASHLQTNGFNSFSNMANYSAQMMPAYDRL